MTGFLSARHIRIFDYPRFALAFAYDVLPKGGVGILYRYMAGRAAAFVNTLKINLNDGRHDSCYGQSADLWE
jgi:hypothetical protein